MAWASLASVAWAAPEPIALHYHAVTGCPNPEFFARQVSARTAQVHFDNAHAGGSFHVVVRRTARGYAGVLSVTDRNGKASIRSFEADRCENVIVALALVAALAIDPNASATPGASPVPAGAPTAAEQATATRETNEATRASSASQTPTLDRSPPSAARAVGAWSWSAGASAQGLGGVTPVLLVAFGGFIGVEKNGAGWAPAFRLSPYYAATGRTGPSVNKADFALLSARISACPFRAQLAKSRLSPCAGIDAGWVRARGSDAAIARPLEQDRLWLSLALDAHFGVTISAPVFLEANLGLSSPLIRQQFQFETPGQPEEVVYRVPSVSGHGGLSLGARFP